MLQAQLIETKDKLTTMERKDKDKSFAQTWQEAATLRNTGSYRKSSCNTRMP